jgi:misacylated tRNA(Ala) deacylase
MWMCATAEIKIAAMKENVEINQASEKFREASIAPMHTAEHLLNATMVKLIGCHRADSAHIERKKSKCDYHLACALTPEELTEIERRVNEAIARDLTVTVEFACQEEVSRRFDMTRLPENATELVRIVKIGDYDECLCVGNHVAHTGEIGHFRISSARYENGVQRIVFRLDR